MGTDISYLAEKRVGDHWEPDGESPDSFGASWLLLQELIEFPWQEKERQFIGLVDAESYTLLKAGQPFKMEQVTPKVLYGFQDRKGSAESPKHVISNEEMETWIATETFDQPEIFRFDALLEFFHTRVGLADDVSASTLRE